jgi:hypothetical protein
MKVFYVIIQENLCRALILSVWFILLNVGCESCLACGIAILIYLAPCNQSDTISNWLHRDSSAKFVTHLILHTHIFFHYFLCDPEYMNFLLDCWWILRSYGESHVVVCIKHLMSIPIKNTNTRNYFISVLASLFVHCHNFCI